MKRRRNTFFPNAVWKHFIASIPCILQNKQKWTKMRSELQQTPYFQKHAMATSFSVPQLEVFHHIIISCSDSKSIMATLNSIFFSPQLGMYIHCTPNNTYTKESYHNKVSILGSHSWSTTSSKGLTQLQHFFISSLSLGPSSAAQYHITPHSIWLPSFVQKCYNLTFWMRTNWKYMDYVIPHLTLKGRHKRKGNYDNETKRRKIKRRKKKKNVICIFFNSK